MDAASTLAPMLRKLQLWVKLDAPQQQALLGLPHTIVTLEKQKVFVSEGDDIFHCWLMLSGYCVRFKYVGTGARQIVSIHMKGDLVDLTNALLGVADHSVQTLTSCKMAKVPIEAIRRSRMLSGSTRSSMPQSIASGSRTWADAMLLPGLRTCFANLRSRWTPSAWSRWTMSFP